MSEQPGTATRFATNGTVRIAYDDAGGAGLEPLLMVMGLGASRFWWPQGLLAALVRRGFHVVGYDLRDAGESTRYESIGSNPYRTLFGRRPVAYSSEDLADDAVAVMDAVGWAGAHLFGHSMGSVLAQRIALRHPARVRSITLSATQPSDASPLRLLRYLRPGMLMRMARLRFPEGPEGDVAFRLAVARAVAAPGVPFDEAEARAAIAREDAHGVVSFRDPRAQSRQTGATWHGGRLGELDVPALVLHGEADPLLRVRGAQDTARAIRGARLRTLPDVGHDLPPRVWDTVADEVRALADQAPARS